MSAGSFMNCGAGGYSPSPIGLSGFLPSPWHSAQRIMYTCMPSRRLASVGSIGFFACGAWRSVEASIAPMANFFSKSEGVWSARRLIRPNLPVTYAAAAPTIKVKMIPRIKLRMASPPTESSSIYLRPQHRQPNAIAKQVSGHDFSRAASSFRLSSRAERDWPRAKQAGKGARSEGSALLGLTSSPPQPADTGLCLAPNRPAPAQKHLARSYLPAPGHHAVRGTESP